MLDFTGEIWFRLLALPIAATLIAALLLKIATRSDSASRLEAAAVGIASAWIVSLTIGVPHFPPPRDGTGIAYLVIGGLVTGAVLDYLLPMIKAANRLWETGLDLAVWLFLVWWMRGDIDVNSLAAFAAWGLAMVRLRRAEASPPNAHAMAVAAAAGLAIIAWIGDSLIDRDMAAGLAVAVLTYLVWQIFLPGATAGFALMWGGYMGIGLITLRLLEISERIRVFCRHGSGKTAKAATHRRLATIAGAHFRLVLPAADFSGHCHFCRGRRCPVLGLVALTPNNPWQKGLNSCTHIG